MMRLMFSPDPHADDEIHAGLNAYERGALERDLAWLEQKRLEHALTIERAARAFADAVLERRPEWICTWSMASRRSSDSPAEVAAGFIEDVRGCARDLVSDFLDHDALDEAARLCGGEDE